MLRGGAVVALHALVIWSALASGGYRGWSLVIVHTLALSGPVLWLGAMVATGRFEWRRTALDLPFGLLVLVVLLQLTIGNGPVVTWALAPVGGMGTTAPDLPVPFLAVGTISPPQTLRALLLMLTYAAAYLLAVQLLTERRQIERFVLIVIGVGGVLALLALLDYIAGVPRLLFWRDTPMGAQRLYGTFANPTHFGAWLGMMICLALGYGATRLWGLPVRRSPDGRRAWGLLLLAGLAIMTIALVFTQSRGAVVSLFLVGAGCLVVLAVRGHSAKGLVLGVFFGFVIVAGIAWIGIEPLLGRVATARVDAGYRWIQAVTSLPMLAAFPLLGTGLGTYIDLFPRYQPAVLKPGFLRYPHAHDDLLQFAIEVGLVGAAIGLVAAWRVGRDLVGAHLLGGGACPVALPAADGARRRDPFSVGIGVGGVAAMLMLMVHSAFDFAARIPANGILAAASLGIATTAFHTRFTAPSSSIAGARVFAIGPLQASAIVAGALVVAVVLVPLIVRPALVDAALATATGDGALGRADDAVRHDPTDVPARRTRALLRLTAATAVANGDVVTAAALTGSDPRRLDARALTAGAIDDLVAAVRHAPTDAALHERLGWAHALMAHLEGGPSSSHFHPALTHLRRAVTLAPENPFLRRAIADFALGQPEPMLELGVAAVREAVQRDPEMLPHEVDRLLWLAPRGLDWSALVPAAPLDRLRLAALLDDRGRFDDAEVMYQQAATLATPPDEPLVRWMHARFLLRTGRAGLARAEAEAALRRDADNPELHLVHALALTATGEDAALGAHEAAVRSAEARHDRFPFPHTEPLLRALIIDRLGTNSGPVPPTRYRRALAKYLTDRGDWPAALREWQRIARESTLDADGWASLGRGLYGTGARERAFGAYRKAIELEPGNVRFRDRLAQHLWDEGKFFQAVIEWRTIAGQQPANVDVRLKLARAYVRMGAPSEAAREYESVLRTMGDHPEARAALARLGPSGAAR